MCRVLLRPCTPLPPSPRPAHPTYPLIERHLQCAPLPSRTASLRHQALHTANILAVGSEEHREELMRASVEEHVMDAMSHSDPQMVVACLWLVINLLYTDMNQTSRSPAAAK